MWFHHVCRNKGAKDICRTCLQVAVLTLPFLACCLLQLMCAVYVAVADNTQFGKSGPLVLLSTQGLFMLAATRLLLLILCTLHRTITTPCHLETNAKPMTVLFRRLNTSQFVPSKHQRKTVSRVNRYMKKQYVPLKISRESIAREDTAALEEHSPSPEPAHSTTSGTRRKSISPPLGKGDTHHADFVQNIHAADLDKMDSGSSWRQFKVVLEPATFTTEKYDLYCEYQRGIHHVPSAMLSRESFDGSVTRSPLSVGRSTLESAPAQTLGLFFFFWRLYKV